MPAAFIHSSIKILCNSICTSARVKGKNSHGEILDCPFCFGLQSDDIAHLVCCPKIRCEIHTRWPSIDIPSAWQPAMAYFCLFDQPSVAEAMIRCFIADLIVKAYLARPPVMYAAFFQQAIDQRIKHWAMSDGAGTLTEIILRLDEYWNRRMLM